jgi:hypothetical protein
MAKKKHDDEGQAEASASAPAGPWKPLTACFMRVDEFAAARAAGIEPENAKFTYTTETRDGVEGVAMTVEEA